MQNQAEIASMWALFKTTLQEWTTDNAAHLAAALAYYTIFSLAPILFIGVAVAGLFYGPEAARGRIVDQIARYTNDEQTAEFIQTLIENARAPAASLVATIAGLIMLFYGATGVFGELKNSLNLIWDAPTKERGGLLSLVLHHLLILAMVMVSGFLLLVSLVMSTALTAATTWINNRAPGMATTTQAINFLFFFIVTVLVFALIYKFVPDVRIAWRDVWIGAVATALLFSVGRFLIALYLTYSTTASTYGAASSLIVLLLWIYYSAQIFFLGAEFTQVYGRTYGSHWREHDLLEMESEESESTTTALAPDRRINARRRFRRFARPLADLAIAVSIIGVLSLVNVVRGPWRK
jgi:membrane protein